MAVLLALGMLCSACPAIWSDECLSWPTISGRGDVSFPQARCEFDPEEARRKAAERAEAEREATESAAAADEQREPAADSEAAAGDEYMNSGPLLASPDHHVPARAGAGRPLNAFMTVRCWRNNKLAKTWSGHTRWSGPVPAEYFGTVERGRIQWEGDVAEGIRVDTRPDGSGGKSIRAFCGAGAQAVFLYVVASHAATGDNPAGGLGKKKSKTASKAPPAPAAQQARTNMRTAAADQERKTRTADKRETRTTNDRRTSTADDRRTTSTADRTSKTDTRKRGSKQSTAADNDVASDEDADDADHDDTDDAADDDDADTGPDAGTGQRAKRDDAARGRCAAGGKCGDEGEGKHKGKQGGSDKGKKGGVLADQGGVLGPGSITGEAFGAKQGGKGGTGKRDDHGARGAGLFGGLVNVPASLRPLAETLLILEDAIPTRLATSWLARKFRNLTVGWLRGRLRHEAGRYAEARMRQFAATISESKVFQSLSPVRQERFLQQMEWEIGRQYVSKLEQGAKEQIKALRTQLGGKLSREARKEARAQLATAEKLLEATRVKPLAGRLPVNHKYAGQWVPRRKLPKKYRDKGLRFTEDGYPDFSPHAIKLPNGKTRVQIKLTGSLEMDFRLADRAAGIAPGKRPAGYTWHHRPDGKTMELVPRDLHERIRHTGGQAHYRHTTGIAEPYGK